eukprot:g11633.t1
MGTTASSSSRRQDANNTAELGGATGPQEHASTRCRWYRRSYKSKFASYSAFSICTINAFLSVVAVNAFVAPFSVNSILSLGSLNSILSVGSANCMLCVGCSGRFMCIGE